MADTTGENNQEQKDDDKTKKNVLEEKSKDELIRLVKKYLSLLQKSKNKTDILNEKCSALEQEKNSLIEKHQSKEQELQRRIDDLQHAISECRTETLTPSEAILENEQLKQKLKESEDKIQNLLLSENQEQLQCLNLQLQTFKASCQCIQEENLNLQNLCKEKSEEIALLVDQKAVLSSNFNKKVEEYNSLFNVKENTQAKYEKSIEEIHSLKTEHKKLEYEYNNLQQKHAELTVENQELKNNIKDSKQADPEILFLDIVKYQNENEDLKKENQALKIENQALSKSKNNSVNDNETGNSSFVKTSSELTNETYDLLVQKNISLEVENKNLQSELDNCHQQICELRNEIGNIVKAYQIDDYKMGIELALLHGASSDKIICPIKPLGLQNEVKISEDKEEYKEMFQNEYHPPEDIYSGLEYALLGGGDASKFIADVNTDVINDMYSMFVPSNKATPVIQKEDYSEVNSKELREEYESLRKRYEAEKKSLQKNLDEYSSLCRDTMNENNQLKQELENLRTSNIKNVCHQQTNTEHEYSKHPEETDNSKHQMKSCEKCNELYNEIFNFYNLIQSEKELSNAEELLETDCLILFKKIKNIFDEITVDLGKKKSELDEYNLQLESLVIGVKHGVRQKNSCYQAKNNPEENINALKILTEDLVSRTTCFDSKLQKVQSEANNKIQEMEDHISQLKELNQFLEDENSELSIEVEKLKSNLNVSMTNLTSYTEGSYLQNKELYSIDESCEIDKPNGKSNIKLNEESVYTCDISVQVCPLIKDFAVQIEPDYCHTLDKMTKDADIQAEFQEINLNIIEQLKNDKMSFKKIADEKSNLVESIHCQMDSLLVKVEELTTELQNKEDDLKHLKCLNADLERMLSEAENIKNQQVNNLKVVLDLILDCKRKNLDLNEDVKSFNSSFKEMFSNMQTEILNSIKEKYNDIKSITEVCDHKENNLTIIKNWISELNTEFEHWLNYMNQISSKPLLNMPSFSDLVENFSSVTLFDKLCHEGACCLISETINNLHFNKHKFFLTFYDHLNNYSSLVKELHSYKMDVIPQMEKKLAVCNCKNESKIQVEVESVQSQISEESLKNTFAETEIKMNKFKQIAVKLKKELASTKEQFNEVILEKEKLQKKNCELLEEMNKLTEDQCKYVQNYQTLQNEFDKLQDECEMHKGNVKKLEEDLAIKLNEFTSIKDQLTDLEKQLKSSKNLIETNVTVKKDLDSKIADLESKIIVLESKISEKEQKLHSKDMEIAKCLKDFNAAQEENKLLKNQLEIAQKEGNKKSLLDLEMADYERSITELNNKIKKKEDEIEDLENEVKLLKEKNDCLHEELKTTESLKETEAKRAESLKEILEKTKSELNEAKEHEAELLSKTASLEVRLESMTQQEEYFKIQQSETSAQIQHLQDIIKSSSENHQRIVRSLEQKISNQKEEILSTHKEVESVKQEFENYKIRVHSVLKQQKSVSPSITSVDSDLKEKLETVNEKLKLQVKELSEKLTALNLEYDSLQEEYQNLSHRYDKLVEDSDKKDKEWNHRLELINAEKNRLRAAQEELSSQHFLQNEMLVATYKKQIKIMSEEHKKIVNDLQKQLDAADVEISRLQRDQQKLQGLPITPLPQDNTTTFDLLSQERQEGEGSENTDEINTPIKHLSLATIPTSGFLPFEKLIQSPVEPGTPASYASAYDIEKLLSDLNTANKRIDHLSELLNDSESTNLRLSEQVRVLKEEVRRLENNRERQQHAENLEYLKNVFIKFATLQPGSEKAMLIPVLTTMLKLNSTEQQQLKSIAGDIQSDDNMNNGWGSYLHRWSGLS